MSEWVQIQDEETMWTFLFLSSKPIVYVKYPETPLVIRVMTYNLAAFEIHKDWDNRVHMIADVIRTANPDIIGLQESCTDPFYGTKGLYRKFATFASQFSKKAPEGRDMLKDLIKIVKDYPHWHWQPAMVYNNKIVEGIAVMSRYPLKDIQAMDLEFSRHDRNNRVCFKCQVELPGHSLQFFNTHITYDTQNQCKQTQKTLDFLELHSCGLPQVLLGDFNFFRRHTRAQQLIEQKQLSDAWAHLHPTDEGNTFPSWEVNERVDRIYYRNVGDPATCEITGYAQSCSTWPSNHCAVYADFVLK